jgi:hypothetical protein
MATQGSDLKNGRITGGYSMRKNVLVVVLSALLLLSMAGVLAGCTQENEEEQNAESTLNIEAFKMTVGSVEFTNYAVALQQTPEEWDALSAEEREAIVRTAFDGVVEVIKTNEISNYNIMGMTAASTDSAGATVEPVIAFRLDRESDPSVLQVFSTTGGADTIGEVAVELP